MLSLITEIKSDLGRVGSDLGRDLGRVGSDLGRVEALLHDTLSASRQASKIKRNDLELALAAAKLRVIPAQDSPDLGALLEEGPDEEDTPTFWWVLKVTGEV